MTMDRFVVYLILVTSIISSSGADFAGLCEVNQTLFQKYNTCLSAEAVCDGKADFDDFSDEKNCGLCGTFNISVSTEHPASILAEVETNSSQISFSVYQQGTPSPPSRVERPAGVDCIWRVTAAPSSSVIWIDVMNVLVTGGGDEVLIRIDDGGEDVGDRALFEVQSSIGAGRLFGNSSSLWILLFKGDYGSLNKLQIDITAHETVECVDEQHTPCPSHTQCFDTDDRCNGIADCRDIGDELGCNKCSDHEFECLPMSECIPMSNICDGRSDCLASNDEFMCPACGESQVNLNPTSLFIVDHRAKAMDCVWAVTSPPGSRIRVTLLHPMKCQVTFGNGPYSRYITSSSGMRSVDNTRSSPLAPVQSRVAYPRTISSSGTSLWIMKKLCRFSYTNGIWFQLQMFTNAECPAGLTLCPSGVTCIEPSAFCDGKIDCPEYGDEIGCGQCEPNEYACLSGGGCTPAGSLCDGKDQCSDQSDEYNCEPCGEDYFNLTEFASVNLSSPAWPRPYPNAVDCTVLLVVKPGHRVMVTFLTFDTEVGYDKLWLGNGLTPKEDVILELSGNVFPSRVASRHHSMYLFFKSDYIIPGPGYSLHVGQFSDQVTCGAGETRCNWKDHICVNERSKQLCPAWECSNDVFTVSKSGVDFTSQNYPRPYPSDLYCQWDVPSSGASPFTLVEVLSFSTEPVNDAVRLSCKDPQGEDSVTFEFTGSTKIKSILINSTEVQVRFQTDSNVERIGFHLRFQKDFMPDVNWCASDFNCGDGTCVSASAKCDGFRDCPNGKDEKSCGLVDCPSFYQCRQTNTCILWSLVCDGQPDCHHRDDEMECDIYRCPANCSCSYNYGEFRVLCREGWRPEHVEKIARKTTALELSGARYSTNLLLSPGIFKDFIFLRSLSLPNNMLLDIPLGTFYGLGNLTYLNISDNCFTRLRMDVFAELGNLEALIINGVPDLEAIEMDAVVGFRRLKTLLLIRGVDATGPLLVEEGAFSLIPATAKVVVDDYKLCCIFKRDVRGYDINNCQTTQSRPPLNLCGSLMQNDGLRVCMWVLAFSALFGNLAVIVWRLRQKEGNQRKKTHSFLVLNLAVSDFLMGLYMLVIAAADAHYGEGYSDVAEEWRASLPCKFAGILSVLSNEASVFFVTLISLDCFFCVVFPFSRVQLTQETARALALVAWLALLCLSVVPTMTADSESDVYGLSDVCIGLPLTSKSTGVQLRPSDIDNPFGDADTLLIAFPTGRRPAWIFSIVVFLGVNLCCFLVVLCCYIAIFVKVKWPKRVVMKRKSAHREREVTMAVKMALIVLTDFTCWMPVIILGILTQTGAVEIGAEAYSWIVVLVLPINSSLNPYLYTVYSAIVDQRRANNRSPGTSEQKSESNCSRRTGETFGLSNSGNI